MDYIKRDTNLYDTIHYVDYPYNIHGDIEGPQPESTNAVTALGQIANTLIFDKSDSARTWGKAFSTLALIHIIGDFHQPLHATSLFSKKWNFLLPFGDVGGNRFKINYVSESGMTYKQIHLLYDCLGGLYCDYMPIVMTPEYEKQIREVTDTLMKEFPKEKYDPEILYPSNMFESKKKFTAAMEAWANESFELSKPLYDQLTPNQTLTPEFITELRAVLLERVAIAGYRLAHVLEKINTTKVGPEPYLKERQLYRVVMIVTSLLFIVALVVATIYKHLYNESRAAAYMSFSTIQEDH